LIATILDDDSGLFADGTHLGNVFEKLSMKEKRNETTKELNEILD